jgi:hypothetical protein
MGVKLSLTLREQHRLLVFENRALRIICGPKRDEIIVFWRKLHKEICNFSSSPYTSRMIKSRRRRWEGHAGCREEKRGFGGKARRKT